MNANLHTVLLRSLESKVPIIREYSAKVKLSQRFSNSFISEDKYREFDKFYLTCCEYQVFVDSHKPLNKYYQPDNWTNIDFLEKTALNYVTILRPSEAILLCEWLSEKYTYSGSEFRLPSVNEEKKLADTKSLDRTKPKKINVDWCGCWCTSGEDFIVVGASKQKLRLVKDKLYEEISFEVENGRELKKNIEDLQTLVNRARNQNRKGDISLENIIQMIRETSEAVSTRKLKSMQIDLSLIEVIIDYVGRVRFILDNLTDSKLTGNIRRLKEAKKSLKNLKEDIQKKVKIKESRYPHYFRNLSILVSFVTINVGKVGFRSQEISSIREIMSTSLSIFLDILDDIHSETDMQLYFLHICLSESRRYLGSNDFGMIERTLSENFSLQTTMEDENKIEGNISFQKLIAALSLLIREAQEYYKIIEKCSVRSPFLKKERRLSDILPFFPKAFSSWTKLEYLEG